MTGSLGLRRSLAQLRATTLIIMKRIPLPCPLRLTCALVAAGSVWAATSPLPAELSEARRWAAAKFQAQPDQALPAPGLYVLANHDPVQLNARGGRPLRLVSAEFTRGLYCHAPSHLIVRLPGPGAAFTAKVGVDSNDQTSGGRGSVRFAVRANDRESFQSGLVREGMPAKPVQVALEGATEFLLVVDDGGDGIACDQADWAEAKVKLEDGTELWLADLPLRQGDARRGFTTEPPFSFQYGGKPSRDLLPRWETMRSTTPLDPQRTRHVTTCTDPQSGLEVRCVGVEYHDFPTVEWTVFFKNCGSADAPLLEDIQALDARLSRPGAEEFVLHHHKGTFVRPDDFEPLTTVLKPNQQARFAPPGGRPCGHVFPYFNLAWGNEGQIVVVGWPGQWAAQFVRDGAHGLRVTAGQEQIRLRLRPGEEVRTPLMVLQFWQGDRVRSQNIWRRWMLAHNVPRINGQLPTPLLTPCSSHQFAEMIKADEASQKLFIDRYLEERLDPDYWWMDAGWYVNQTGWPNTGTWLVDSNRFPRGLRAITDHAHAKGVKSIVWFEPERVTPGTELYAHRDWLLGRDGEQKLLNLGHPEAFQWLTDHVDQLLTQQGIDLYRQDYNVDPLGYWRGADAEDRQGMTENRYVAGYLGYWDELRRRHPGMLIDSCASGGHRNDLETLRRALPFLRSDSIFDPVGNQGHTYGLASWLPYHGTGTAPRQFSLYELRSNLACPHDIPCWDVRDRTLDYDLLRRVVADWRRYANLYFGDFHPLTPYSLEASQWMAWQFNEPEVGRGMVQAFRRARSPYESARFQLEGLDPKARYRLENLDQPAAAVETTGHELLERGVLVQAPDQPGAVVILYQEVRP